MKIEVEGLQNIHSDHLLSHLLSTAINSKLVPNQVNVSCGKDYHQRFDRLSWLSIKLSRFVDALQHGTQFIQRQLTIAKAWPETRVASLSVTACHTYYSHMSDK